MNISVVREFYDDALAVLPVMKKLMMKLEYCYKQPDKIPKERNEILRLTWELRRIAAEHNLLPTPEEELKELRKTGIPKKKISSLMDKINVLMWRKMLRRKK